MKIKSLVAIAALAATGVTSNYAVADTTTVIYPSPNASFSANVIGSFNDTWTFNLASPSVVAASLTNVEVSFGSFSYGGIIDFMATLNGIPLLSNSQQTTIGPVTTNVQVLAGSGNFGPGIFSLNVSGNAGSGASYGGNIVAAPIPEPESYALFLAGLGIMGAIARRRSMANVA